MNDTLTKPRQSAPIKAKPLQKQKLKSKFDFNIPLLLFPYGLLFCTFILAPVIMAVVLSFTYFNTVQPPVFNGVKNYIDILTQDTVFMQKVLPNTLQFSLIVGPGSYALQYLLAWALAQVPKGIRMVLALVFYSPSMTAGVTMTVIWRVVFSGDRVGYLNSFLLLNGFIEKPIAFLQSPETLMPIMIFVTLWSSMGIGFLAMLGGILNIDQEIYEAGYVDGIKNRFQETFYITIPSMKPQMLFGAVMAIVGTFNAGQIGVDLSGTNPTPLNAGQLVVNHIEDYGLLRYDMGTATALAVILLLMIFVFSKVANKLFANKD